METNLLSCKKIIAWLCIWCFLLLCMVGIGGYTRLTDSGLSITEWRPVTGIIPPLNEIEWQNEMDKYKSSPEYLKINKGFSVQEFKDIYWVEYFHRLMGRVIGIFFLIPWLYFCITRQLDSRRAWQLFGIFILGGVQGAIGWYMVQSGLIENPHVSQYRLTLHLMVAMLIYGLLLWIMFGYILQNKKHNKIDTFSNNILYNLCLLLLCLIVVQSALGGFVAGLKAGFIYNTYPLMDGELLPDTAWIMSPWYRNFAENAVMVQFIHRVNAIVVLVCGAFLLWYSCKHGMAVEIRKNITILFGMIFLQVLLGVLTLIYQVPIALGVVHQVYAFLLFGKTLFVLYYLRVVRKGPVG